MENLHTKCQNVVDNEDENIIDYKKNIIIDLNLM